VVGVVGVAVAVADDGEGGADVDGLVLLGHDLLQGAGDGGGDLGVDLVGGDLEQGLVDLDGVADGLEPLGDGALGDGLAEFGHDDVGALVAAPASGGLLGRGGLLGGLVIRGIVGLVGLVVRVVGIIGGAGAGVVVGLVRVVGPARAVVDDGEFPADLDRLVLIGDDLLQRAGGGR